MGTRQPKITLKDIQDILPTFSRPEILELDQKIHQYLETLTFSKAAETAFSDWNDPEEGLYDGTFEASEANLANNPPNRMILP